MSLRINFVLPSIPKISGGPLAILEYANRFVALGHVVTITTYPDSHWHGNDPFPWFKFNGEYCYKRTRSIRKYRASSFILKLLNKIGIHSFARNLYYKIFARHSFDSVSEITDHTMPFDFLANEPKLWLDLIESMPDCDLNIATFWSTAYPVYLSHKGKPVYFMQHYEEIFYDLNRDHVIHKLLARSSYALPIYKVSNSSWLSKKLLDDYGQAIPFSNNAIDLVDFDTKEKLSAVDGRIRVITFSRPEQWKGFAEAVEVMRQVFAQYGNAVEWNVFGYRHTMLDPDNTFAPYNFHQGLSFKELSALYAGSDIALCTSWYESFPLPALEAMASGTAVVTSRYGTEDYAHHKINSLVVVGRDINSYVQSMCDLIEDSELRCELAKNGRSTAEQFGWDIAVKNREKLLYDIHNGLVDYDIHQSCYSNFRDYNGLPFERIDLADTGLVVYDGKWFLVKNGTKFHIVRPEILDNLFEMGYSELKLDPVVCARIPSGDSIFKTTDL